jgi:hypothetical protein
VSGTSIRDFIYLDIERVRSFSAQLFGGLPSERTTLGEHEIGGEGSATGKLPLFVEASGAVNYHYLRSQSETRSLHDHLFNEFFARLVSEDKIQNLGAVPQGKWQESLFKDGAFMSVTCPIKIVDYKANVALLETLPDMQSLVGKAAGFSSSANQQRMQAADLRKARSPQQMKGSEQELFQKMRPQIKAMSSLMAQLYGDFIRLKIFPYQGNFEKILVGSTDRTAFRYPPAALTTPYGAIIDAGWVCVVQVNRGTTHVAGAVVSSSGNQMEDSFEQLVDQFTALSSLTQGITFPAVAVTPIAIYRTIA